MFVIVCLPVFFERVFVTEAFVIPQCVGSPLASGMSGFGLRMRAK